MRHISETNQSKNIKTSKKLKNEKENFNVGNDCSQ